MTTPLRFAIVCSVMLTGCRASSCGATPADRRPERQAAPRERPAAPQGIVRIAPEMMRDLRVTTTVVELRPRADEVAVLGELAVNQDKYAEVGSPVAARIVSVAAGPGERVRRGQPLANLQSIDLGRARGEQFTAQARLDLAQKTLERKRRLAAERIVAAREVQEAEAAVAEAAATLRASQATLGAMSSQAAGASDAGFSLRAPIAGIVLERTAVQGQMTDPAVPLYRIADLSRLWLTVHAFERDAVRIQIGGSARIAFSALPGETFSGRITLVGGEVDVASRTIPIRIEVENPDAMLRPGMAATAWVPIGDVGTTLLAVPAAALQRLEENWCVFIPQGPGEFEVRSVGRGRDLGGEVEILSGLRPGDTIVVDGAFLLKAEAEKAKGASEGHPH